MIKEFLLKRARKKALDALIKEIKEYQVKIAAADSETFLNIFNTGLMLNVKTAGTKLLDIAAAVLKKEAEKRKKE
jgi:hypothetical protein